MPQKWQLSQFSPNVQGSVGMMLLKCIFQQRLQSIIILISSTIDQYHDVSEASWQVLNTL
jgi:hypothetical protein